MTIQPELTPQEKQKQAQAVQQLFDFTVAELNKGTDRQALVQKLVDTGMEQAEASKYVGAVQAQLSQISQQEQMEGVEYLPGIIGGLLGAVIGGVIWGLIGVATGKEFGYLALGVGALAGGGTLLLAGRKKGLPLQIIASLTGVLGILVGKYYYFIDALKNQNQGMNILDYVSFETMQIFAMQVFKMLNFYDALWAVLAVVMAWGMLKPTASAKATGVNL